MTRTTALLLSLPIVLAAQLASPVSGITVVAPPAVVAESDAPQTQPAVAALTDGRFVVVLEDGTIDDGFTDPPFPIDGRDGSLEGIVGHLIDERGRLVGDPFIVNAITEERQICPKVASDPSTGGFVVAWLDTSRGGRAIVRRFDADARPVTGDIVLPSSPASFCGVGLAVTDSGTALVTVRTLDEVLAFHVATDGMVTLTDTITDSSSPSVFVSDLLATADGGAVLATRINGGIVRLHRLDGDGRWIGPYTASFDAFSSDVALRSKAEAPDEQELVLVTARLGDVTIHRLDIDDLDAMAESVVLDETATWTSLTALDGDLVLATGRDGDPPGTDSPSAGRLSVRRLDADLALVGAIVDLAVGLGSRFNAPMDIAMHSTGRCLVGWARDFTGPIDRALFDAAAIPTLPLGDRFEVQVYWQDFEGQDGFGVPVPLSSDTGAFWFFDPENLEVTVKVLDGRPINGHFWVFNGSLTNVRYDISVTDTVTGAVYVYRNPLGTFGSFGDTEALPGD
ncbi:MAG: hypothetical protein AAGE94_02250 [Acidobacteriota bacterium]